MRRRSGHMLLCALAVAGAAYAPVGRAPVARPTVQRAAATMGASQHLSRRALFAGTIALVAAPTATLADEKKWVSGKSDPLRPTSKDKPDGTKKDNKYISCLNDCVPRKQGPPGPNQKDRIDCLDSCQQECCFTYEQCTYSIRK